MTEDEQDRVIERFLRDPGSISLEEAKQVVVVRREDGTVVYLPESTLADWEERHRQLNARLYQLRDEQLRKSRN
jgi:hypothetical protein